MLHDVPDWATRHGYHITPIHGPRTGPRPFTKGSCPASNRTGLRYPQSTKDASDADKLLARSVLHRLYDGRSSANMEAGKATQTACDLYLVMDEVGETLGLSGNAGWC